MGQVVQSEMPNVELSEGDVAVQKPLTMDELDLFWSSVGIKKKSQNGKLKGSDNQEKLAH